MLRERRLAIEARLHEHVDRVVGKLVVVIGRPVVVHARRVVDHALEVGVFHRTDEVDLGRQLAEWRERFRPLVDATGEEPRDRDAGRALQVLGHERLGRAAQHDHRGTELVGRVGRDDRDNGERRRPQRLRARA